MKPVARFRQVALAALLASAGAPAPAQEARMNLPFNAAEVAWSRGSGSATVQGRAALNLPGQMPQTCAGGEAQLFPAGAYAAEMMRVVFGSDARGFTPLATARYPANIAPDFAATVRRVGCDAEGRFRFDNVPAGRWYVFSNVVFRDARDGTPQGGSLMQRIDVTEGARSQVVLAP